MGARLDNKSLAFKILKNTSKVGDCWVWTKSVGSHGYGNICTGASLIETAHRVSYEVFNGEIPAGQVIMHSCNNKRCCNPAHLSAGTQSQNMLDGLRNGRDSPMSREVLEDILKSDETTANLSKRLGISYSRIWKARKSSTLD